MLPCERALRTTTDTIAMLLPRIADAHDCCTGKPIECAANLLCFAVFFSFFYFLLILFEYHCNRQVRESATPYNLPEQLVQHHSPPPLTLVMYETITCGQL